VREHPGYLDLGATANERQLAYRRLFDTPAAADEVDTIRLYLQRQHALGSSRFKDAIERQLARRVGPATVGRPRKPRQSEETALCPLF
jgi:putative transposase